MAIEEPLAQPLPARRRIRAPIVLGALILTLLVGGGIAAFVASKSAGSDAPPRPGELVVPEVARPVALFDVREADGQELTLLPANTEADALTVVLAAGTTIEALVPTTADVIAPGHWLTILGNADPVRNFVIRHIILLPEPSAPAADGLARSPAGFVGDEVIPDKTWLPIIWGLVETVAPGEIEGTTLVTLSSPDGPITVQLFAGVTLSSVAPYTSAITDGDRIATRARPGTSPAEASAVLVSPQGAR